MNILNIRENNFFYLLSSRDKSTILRCYRNTLVYSSLSQNASADSSSSQGGANSVLYVADRVLWNFTLMLEEWSKDLNISQLERG